MYVFVVCVILNEWIHLHYSIHNKFSFSCDVLKVRLKRFFFKCRNNLTKPWKKKSIYQYFEFNSQEDLDRYLSQQNLKIKNASLNIAMKLKNSKHNPTLIFSLIPIPSNPSLRYFQGDFLIWKIHCYFEKLINKHEESVVTCLTEIILHRILQYLPQWYDIEHPSV